MSKHHDHSSPHPAPAHKPPDTPVKQPHPAPAQAPEPAKAPPQPQQPSQTQARPDVKALLGNLHAKVQGNNQVEQSAHDLIHGLADVLEQPGADAREVARHLRSDAPHLARAVFENTPALASLPSAHTGQVYTAPQGGSYEGSEKQKRGGKT